MHKNKKLIVKFLLVVIAALILLLFPGLRRGTDKTVENVYSIIAGERQPDTNIVIIHISASDLESIGPWPIKRSYYALLIKNLTAQNVKKIGLEVFLSSRMVTQSIYDKLLKNEIERSGKVVLSSLAGRITKANNKFYTDSLSYPSPKLLNKDFLTGHLNYLKNNGIEIPLVIDNHGLLEKAFSYQLYGKESGSPVIMLNFISSWNKFRHYSLLEYFQLVRENSTELKSFKDKTIIIGISDSQIASTIETAYDNDLPGVALHAFALDNLLNARWLKTNYYLLSGILFLLFLLGLILFQPKIKANNYYIYLFTFGGFLIVTFILSIVFNYKLALSFFIFPYLFVITADAVYFVLEKQNILKGALDESEVLKKLLEVKESELNRLQRELDVTGERGSETLVEQIRSLKNDIEKLRDDEEDKTKAEFPAGESIKEFHGIIYRSKVMNSVVELIKKAAPVNATVLIVGESGTGKELVAKAIHRLSERKNNNFVAVNCAALTETLLESELFGYVKGAFTGASSDKMGRFEAADKGTIFLDEIGETSDNFQAKLLRVLQSGEIEKVGSPKQFNVDVRVVAATNKELEFAVNEKRFREDLYYRLNVVKIELPPLRERKEDIEVLTAHFLSEEKPGMSLSKSALGALLDYNWKGNVRELESVIKRAVIFAEAEGRDIIKITDLPKEIVKKSKYNFEDLVLESLRAKKFSHSSITETAKELGDVNRTMVAEHFRGAVFKTLYENNFDIEKTVILISDTDDNDVNERVNNKIRTFLNNIENDISSSGIKEFELAKSKFSSKYKNLPVKFHHYLDEVIKWKLS
ncbi:transcriptional regulatory protein ZraR [bacterium BMS3Abin03]|nr:transcriptional regulatory protein ZraR [bacterium BMS3Abin03]